MPLIYWQSWAAAAGVRGEWCTPKPWKSAQENVSHPSDPLLGIKTELSLRPGCDLGSGLFCAGDLRWAPLSFFFFSCTNYYLHVQEVFLSYNSLSGYSTSSPQNLSWCIQMIFYTQS